MFGVSLKFSLIPAGSHNFCHMSAGVLSAARLYTKDHSSLLQHDKVKSMIKHVKYAALGRGNFVIESFYHNQIQSWLSSAAPPSHPNMVTSYSKKNQDHDGCNAKLKASSQSSDWNIWTTVGWIAIKLGTDIVSTPKLLRKNIVSLKNMTYYIFNKCHLTSN